MTKLKEARKYPKIMLKEIGYKKKIDPSHKTKYEPTDGSTIRHVSKYISIHIFQTLQL
jgi:hypothetical protein